MMVLEFTLVLLLLAILIFVAGLTVIALTRAIQSRHPVIRLYIYHSLAVVGFAIFVLLALYSLYRSPSPGLARPFVYPGGTLESAFLTLGQRVFQALQVPLALAVGLAAVRVPIRRWRSALLVLTIGVLALMVSERVVNLWLHIHPGSLVQSPFRLVWWASGGVLNAAMALVVGGIVYARRRHLVISPLVSVSRYLLLVVPLAALILATALFPAILMSGGRQETAVVPALVIATMMIAAGIWPLVNGIRLLQLGGRIPGADAATPYEWDRLKECGVSVSEERVIRLLALGKTNLRIAEELGVAPSTVKNQLYSAYRKLAVTNRLELLAVLRTP